MPLCSSSNVHPLVIAAHPQEPNEFALGLSDGGVHVFEPLESEGKWGVPPPVDNGSTSSMPATPPVGGSGSDQAQRWWNGWQSISSFRCLPCQPPFQIRYTSYNYFKLRPLHWVLIQSNVIISVLLMNFKQSVLVLI